jgi:hypothetical protein
MTTEKTPTAIDPKEGRNMGWILLYDPRLRLLAQPGKKNARPKDTKKMGTPTGLDTTSLSTMRLDNPLR